MTNAEDLTNKTGISKIYHGHPWPRQLDIASPCHESDNKKPTNNNNLPYLCVRVFGLFFLFGENVGLEWSSEFSTPALFLFQGWAGGTGWDNVSHRLEVLNMEIWHSVMGSFFRGSNPWGRVHLSTDTMMMCQTKRERHVTHTHTHTHLSLSLSLSFPCMISSFALPLSLHLSLSLSLSPPCMIQRMYLPKTCGFECGTPSSNTSPSWDFRHFSLLRLLFPGQLVLPLGKTMETFPIN